MDISLLFVILCAVFYRLSVSMLIYLIIYLTYYFIVFHEIHNVYSDNQFYNHLNLQIDQIDDNIQKLYDEKAENLYEDTRHFGEFKQTFELVCVKMEEIKARYKKWLWFSSSLLTILCLVLTYSSQFFISYYCDHYCPDPERYGIFITRKVLFILGLSTSDQYSLWRSIYFYFWMVFVNMVQRCANTWRVNVKRKKDEELIEKVMENNLMVNPDNKLEGMMERQFQMMEEEKHVPQDQIESKRFHTL